MAFEQHSCQSCGVSMTSPLFCFSCNSLQTIADNINYFEVLGFPLCFEIDHDELGNRYQRLSLEMHPDFFATAPEKEKRLSEKSSALLNAAFSTLRKPTSRARYLLSILTGDKRLKSDTLPEGFLQEMFTLQESLDELLESGDETALSGINENLQGRHTDIESDYAVLFKKFETSPENSEILQQLQTQLNSERYLRRLLDRINTE